MQRSITHWSQNEFTTIKPTCNDRVPQYFFTETDEGMPQSALYQPLVVSPERFKELEKRGLVYGYLVIDVTPDNMDSPLGLCTSDMSAAERETYAGKIPIADEYEGFAYPINNIVVYGYEGDVMLDTSYELNATTDYYQPATNMGNLYLKRSLSEVAPLSFSSANNGFYKMVLNISKVVPYDEEEYMQAALSQATQYAVMDYFDQYTYASTTAQMIAEIGYTVSMTVTSTAISAPSMLLGAYSKVIIDKAFEGITKGTAIALTLLLTFARLPAGMIAEAMEEVIVDSFVETLFQSLVRSLGGTDALGHWISTLITTLRETGMFGYFTGGFDTNGDADTSIETDTQTVAQQVDNIGTQNVLNSDTETATETSAQILSLRDALRIAYSGKGDSRKLLVQLFGAGLFGGLMLLMPAFAGFSYYGLKNMAKLTSNGYSILKDRAAKRHLIENVFKKTSEDLKKPVMDDDASDINSEISEDATVKVVPVNQQYEGFHPMGKVDHFWALPPDIMDEINFEIAKAKAQQNEIEKEHEKIDRYKDFDPITNGIQIAPFPFYISPKKVTLKSFIVDDLGYTDRILQYTIFVNGRLVDFIDDEIMSYTMINKGDVIWITPREAFVLRVRDMFKKLQLEISLVDSNHPYYKLKSYRDLFSATDINLIYEYYSMVGKDLHDQLNSPSDAYVDDYKFFIDELCYFLEKYTGKNYNMRSLSKILSSIARERYLRDVFQRMKLGDQFKLEEDYINTIYSAIWLELEFSLSGDQKKMAQAELDKLMLLQYNIYNYEKGSPCYYPLRSAHYKLFTLIDRKTSIQYQSHNSKISSIDDFNRFFHFSPHWYDTYPNTNQVKFDDPSFVPNFESWMNLGNLIIQELYNMGYYTLIPIVKGIINEVRTVLGFYSLGPLSSYPDTPKNRLLQSIIMNPYIKEFRLLNLKELSFILFDNPAYPYQKAGKSYISAVYLVSKDIVYGTIGALRHRISVLTISDFNKIGIEGIKQSLIRKFIFYAEDIIDSWLRYNKLSFSAVGISYQTYGLRNLQLKTLYAMWEAAAHATGNFWISFEDMARYYFGNKISKFNVYSYIKDNKILSDWMIRDAIDKLENLITKSSEFSSSPSFSPINIHSFDTVLRAPSLKVQAYIRAQSLLEELGTKNVKDWEAWSLQESKTIFWFDDLFQPSVHIGKMTYAKGFADKEYSDFKDWLVTMSYCELLGTDPISGQSIPNKAYEKSRYSTFALQHIMRNNKLSIALFEMYLTWSQMHGPGESISDISGHDAVEDLVTRLRRLLEIGISRKCRDQATQLWITEDDFDKLFPTTLVYKGRYQSRDYEGSLKHLWGEVFTDKSFREKLIEINKKIDEYKDALSKGINPYRAVMKEFAPAGERRFWDGAERASKLLLLFGKNRMSPFGHTLGDIMNNWQYKMFKRIFGDLI